MFSGKLVFTKVVENLMFKLPLNFGGIRQYSLGVAAV